MTNHESQSAEAPTTSESAPSAEELEDAAVDAMRSCEKESNTDLEGAPRGAVVGALQDEYEIEENTATQAILNAQMAGRAYLVKGSENADKRHVRAPDEPQDLQDPRDDIATSGNPKMNRNSDTGPHPSPEDLGTPPEELGPTELPEDGSETPSEEQDYILDDDQQGREPEFPDSMSGESIRLRGDEDEDWREPQSMY